MSFKIITFFLLMLVFAEISCITDKIICYYINTSPQRPGNGKFLPENIQAELCTHIIYAYLGLDLDGTLITSQNVGVNQDDFNKLSALKHKNPNLKLLFSVGGAAANIMQYAQVSGRQESMEKMWQDAVNLCKTYNFDGLDIAWMYPRGGERSKYIDLLKTLKNGLQPKGYLLSASLYSLPKVADGYIIPTVSDILDLMNVMTYDFSDMWGPTFHNAPLYGLDNMTDFENRNVNVSIQNWLDGGADPQKVNLAVPFFGHSFYLSNVNDHGIGAKTYSPADPGPYTGLINSLGYNEICEFYRNGTVVFLDDIKVPYLYDGKLWVGYDNEKSALHKVQYAKDYNLGGVMIWSVDTDDRYGFCGEKSGLLKSVYNAMHKSKCRNHL